MYNCRRFREEGGRRATEKQSKVSGRELSHMGTVKDRHSWRWKTPERGVKDRQRRGPNHLLVTSQVPGDI